MTPRTLVVAAFLSALATAAPGMADVIAPQAKAQSCTINGLPCDMPPSDATLQYGAARMGVLGVVSNSVNGQAGTVVLPTYTRQTNSTPITPDAQGNATFTFPTPFTNIPSCPVEVMATTTAYVFSNPITVAKSLTSVTVNLAAIPKTITVGTLGASLPLSAPPPAGTQVNFYCFAPN